MPDSESPVTVRFTALDSLPSFELSCLMDNPDFPTEVTICPAEVMEENTTEWITIDYEWSLSLDECL